MKKKYIKPTIDVIEIDAYDIIASSPGVSDTPFNPDYPNL